MTGASALPVAETSGEAVYRQCGRKKIYPDRETAQLGADAMRSITHRSQRFNPYHCNFCHGWHIGRQRTREQGIRRAQRQGVPLAS